jgi:hypothetical protein
MIKPKPVFFVDKWYGFLSGAPLIRHKRSNNSVYDQKSCSSCQSWIARLYCRKRCAKIFTGVFNGRTGNRHSFITPVVIGKWHNSPVSGTA